MTIINLFKGDQARTYRGTWNKDTGYYEDNVVKGSDGSAYICVVQFTSGSDPTKSPTEWKLLIEKKLPTYTTNQVDRVSANTFGINAGSTWGWKGDEWILEKSGNNVTLVRMKYNCNCNCNCNCTAIVSNCASNCNCYSDCTTTYNCNCNCSAITTNCASDCATIEQCNCFALWCTSDCGDCINCNCTATNCNCHTDCTTTYNCNCNCTAIVSNCAANCNCYSDCTTSANCNCNCTAI